MKSSIKPKIQCKNPIEEEGNEIYDDDDNNDDDNNDDNNNDDNNNKNDVHNIDQCKNTEKPKPKNQISSSKNQNSNRKNSFSLKSTGKFFDKHLKNFDKNNFNIGTKKDIKSKFKNSNSKPQINKKVDKTQSINNKILSNDEMEIYDDDEAENVNEVENNKDNDDEIYDDDENENGDNQNSNKVNKEYEENCEDAGETGKIENEKLAKETSDSKLFGNFGKSSLLNKNLKFLKKTTSNIKKGLNIQNENNKEKSTIDFLPPKPKQVSENEEIYDDDENMAETENTNIDSTDEKLTNKLKDGDNNKNNKNINCSIKGNKNKQSLKGLYKKTLVLKSHLKAQLEHFSEIPSDKIDQNKSHEKQEINEHIHLENEDIYDDDENNYDKNEGKVMEEIVKSNNVQDGQCDELKSINSASSNNKTSIFKTTNFKSSILKKQLKNIHKKTSNFTENFKTQIHNIADMKFKHKDKINSCEDEIYEDDIKEDDLQSENNEVYDDDNDDNQENVVNKQKEMSVLSTENEIYDDDNVDNSENIEETIPINDKKIIHPKLTARKIVKNNDSKPNKPTKRIENVNSVLKNITKNKNSHDDVYDEDSIHSEDKTVLDKNSEIENNGESNEIYDDENSEDKHSEKSITSKVSQSAISKKLYQKSPLKFIKKKTFDIKSILTDHVIHHKKGSSDISKHSNSFEDQVYEEDLKETNVVNTDDIYDADEHDQDANNDNEELSNELVDPKKIKNKNVSGEIQKNRKVSISLNKKLKYLQEKTTNFKKNLKSSQHHQDLSNETVSQNSIGEDNNFPDKRQVENDDVYDDDENNEQFSHNNNQVDEVQLDTKSNEDLENKDSLNTKNTTIKTPLLDKKLNYLLKKTNKLKSNIKNCALQFQNVSNSKSTKDENLNEKSDHIHQKSQISNFNIENDDIYDDDENEKCVDKVVDNQIEKENDKVSDTESDGKSVKNENDNKSISMNKKFKYLQNKTLNFSKNFKRQVQRIKELPQKDIDTTQTESKKHQFSNDKDEVYDDDENLGMEQDKSASKESSLNEIYDEESNEVHNSQASSLNESANSKEKEKNSNFFVISSKFEKKFISFQNKTKKMKSKMVNQIYKSPLKNEKSNNEEVNDEDLDKNKDGNSIVNDDIYDDDENKDEPQLNSHEISENQKVFISEETPKIGKKQIAMNKKLKLFKNNIKTKVQQMKENNSNPSVHNNEKKHDIISNKDEEVYDDDENLDKNEEQNDQFSETISQNEIYDEEALNDEENPSSSLSEISNSKEKINKHFKRLEVSPFLKKNFKYIQKQSLNIKSNFKSQVLQIQEFTSKHKNKSGVNAKEHNLNSCLDNDKKKISPENEEVYDDDENEEINLKKTITKSKSEISEEKSEELLAENIINNENEKDLVEVHKKSQFFNKNLKYMQKKTSNLTSNLKAQIKSIKEASVKHKNFESTCASQTNVKSNIKTFSTDNDDIYDDDENADGNENQDQKEFETMGENDIYDDDSNETSSNNSKDILNENNSTSPPQSRNLKVLQKSTFNLKSNIKKQMKNIKHLALKPSESQFNNEDLESNNNNENHECEKNDNENDNINDNNENSKSRKKSITSNFFLKEYKKINANLKIKREALFKNDCKSSEVNENQHGDHNEQTDDIYDDDENTFDNGNRKKSVSQKSNNEISNDDVESSEDESFDDSDSDGSLDINKHLRNHFAHFSNKLHSKFKKTMDGINQLSNKNFKKLDDSENTIAKISNTDDDVYDDDEAENSRNDKLQSKSCLNQNEVEEQLGKFIEKKHKNLNFDLGNSIKFYEKKLKKLENVKKNIQSQIYNTFQNKIKERELDKNKVSEQDFESKSNNNDDVYDEDSDNNDDLKLVAKETNETCCSEVKNENIKNSESLKNIIPNKNNFNNKNIQDSDDKTVYEIKTKDNFNFKNQADLKKNIKHIQAEPARIVKEIPDSPVTKSSVIPEQPSKPLEHDKNSISDSISLSSKDSQDQNRKEKESLEIINTNNVKEDIKKENIRKPIEKKCFTPRSIQQNPLKENPAISRGNPNFTNKYLNKFEQNIETQSRNIRINSEKNPLVNQLKSQQTLHSQETEKPKMVKKQISDLSEDAKTSNPKTSNSIQERIKMHERLINS